jgi:hypothetical protein
MASAKNIQFQKAKVLRKKYQADCVGAFDKKKPLVIYIIVSGREPSILTITRSYFSQRGMPLSPFAVETVQLFVQGPIVIDVADQEQTSGEEVEDAREPLVHVKAVNP